MEQRLAKQRNMWLSLIMRNDHILTFGEVFETSLTSSNSFHVCFAGETINTACMDFF